MHLRIVKEINSEGLPEMNSNEKVSYELSSRTRTIKVANTRNKSYGNLNNPREGSHTSFLFVTPVTLVQLNSQINHGSIPRCVTDCESSLRSVRRTESASGVLRGSCKIVLRRRRNAKGRARAPIDMPLMKRWTRHSPDYARVSSSLDLLLYAPTSANL